MNYVTWHFEKMEIYAYSRVCESFPQGATRYSVKNSGSHFILLIKDLTLEDGGTYKCSTDTDEISVNLLVFGE